MQQTTEFIHNLQQEKAKVLAQNAYFKRVLSEVSRRCNIDLETDISLYGGLPPLKRKKRDTGQRETHTIGEYSIDGNVTIYIVELEIHCLNYILYTLVQQTHSLKCLKDLRLRAVSNTPFLILFYHDTATQLHI